jgi:arylsulfatase A-like enzyme
MRPQLKCYGHDYMITPNLDKLAATGTQFDFAYTQFAYCAPSRNSFLSGRRPDRTTAISFLKTFRERPGGTSWVAMPQLFKEAGWWTSAAGKIYHDGENDWRSWGYPSKNTAWIQCVPGDVGKGQAGKPGEPEVPETLKGNETNFNSVLYNYCTVTENSTNPLTNENISLTLGLERMDLAHASGRPWWVSIGVHRPHWPWRGGEKCPHIFFNFITETDLFSRQGSDQPQRKVKQCALHRPWLRSSRALSEYITAKVSVPTYKLAVYVRKFPGQRRARQGCGLAGDDCGTRARS